jgi:hypothetical protein
MALVVQLLPVFKTGNERCSAPGEDQRGRTMLLPSLMRLIETHAEELTERLIKAVRTNPRTAYLHQVSEAELKRAVFDLYHNLGRWLGEKSEAKIETTYRENGRRRFREGVPLSELVLALTLMKQQLWEFIRQNDLPETATHLYGEEQLELMVGQFFDKVLYHAVRGYEEAWLNATPLRLPAGTPRDTGLAGPTTSIARAVLGAIEARRGVLDSDTGLRGVAVAVKLDPAGKVRAVTVQQDSESV